MDDTPHPPTGKPSTIAVTCTCGRTHTIDVSRPAYDPETDRRWLALDAAADLTGASRWTIRRLALDGEVELRRGARNRIEVRPADVVALGREREARIADPFGAALERGHLRAVGGAR